MYAVGGDPHVARLSGLRPDRITVSAYVLAGGLAGVAGLVLIGGTGVGDSSAASGLEFESLAVVVIGGASLAGGRGRLTGVFGGVVLFSMLGNVFNLLDVEVWYQQLVRGAVILVAAALYVQRRPKPVLATRGADAARRPSGRSALMAMTGDNGRGMGDEERDDFLLTGRLFAKIATTMDDGWPVVSPVWYAWDGSSFLVVSKARHEPRTEPPARPALWRPRRQRRAALQAGLGAWGGRVPTR